MNKVAFISGASSGFGEAIARMLDLNGYHVVISARREDRLLKLAKELKNAYIIACDIRDKDAVFNGINNLPNEFKNISVLINNAGLALGQEPVNEASLEDFETMIDTNIKGLVYTTKAVLPSLIKSGNGYIFNLSSVAGVWPYPGGNVYGGTKAFVKQFSYNLRNDLMGTGVRVTNISPGIAKTEFSNVRFKGDIKKADAVYDGTEYLRADDIATIILNCLKLPRHVNINELEVMPTSQSWAGFRFERD